MIAGNEPAVRLGSLYAVLKKFGDDRANQFVVALGWFGFISIYPLLLVVITVFGFVGAASWATKLSRPFTSFQ